MSRELAILRVSVAQEAIVGSLYVQHSFKLNSIAFCHPVSLADEFFR